MKRWHAVPIAALVALAVGAALFGSTNTRVEAGLPTVTLSVDCDTGTGGIQSACVAAAGAQSVDIVFSNNSGATIAVQSFQLDIVAFPQPDLNPTGVPTTTQTGPPGNLDCSLTPPIQDQDPDANTANSFIGCFGFGSGISVASGTTIVLATLNYTGTANPSTVTLSNNAVVGDVNIVEVVNCNPSDSSQCVDATFGGGSQQPPTPTPTGTATVAATPTPCEPNCPSPTPLTFVTVTPTPCDPNCPTATPGAGETPPPGGETPGVPPGGTPGAGNQTPGAGGTPGSGTIQPPDTGDGSGPGGYNWARVIVMTLIAVGVGGLAGGGYLFATSRANRE